MRKKSILIRVILGILIIMILPTLAFSLFYRNTINVNMQKRAETNVHFFIDQVENSLTGALEMSRSISFNLLADTQLRSTMNAENSLIYSKGRARLEDIVGGSTVFWPEDSQKTFRSFYIFRDDGAVISYAKGGTFAQQKRHMEAVYEETKNLSSASQFFKAMDDEKLYYVLDYTNIDYLTHLGKIIIELDPDPILNTQELMGLYDGAVIYLNDTPDFNGYLHKTGMCEEEDLYQLIKQVGNYDLWLKIDIPQSAIYGELQQVSQRYYWIMTISLVAVVMLTAMLYLNIRKPLKKLADTLGQMRNSDYSVRLPVSGFREFDSIETSFNQMADSLDASFQDAYNKGIALQKSETRLLTAQINPHFVFNILETINMKCVEAGQKDISHIVTDLAQFLRGNIGIGSSQKITLREELAYVRYYMDLQQTRFGRNLTCSIDYEDEDMLDNCIPRLSIQPIVENAVVHGLEPRRGLGDISIRMWEEDDSIEIRIKDNGVGFESDAVDLNNREDTGHNHIAIPNIRRRLQLLYGEKASLKVSSTPGIGTEVLMTLPIDQEVD